MKLGNKNAGVLNVVMAALLAAGLAGCQADSSSSGSSEEGSNTSPDGGAAGPDNNVQMVSGADGTEGDAFLYSINESGDGLEELNRVSLENAGALFDVDPIPELPFVRVQPFEGPTRWGIPLNVQSGQTIAISPLTQVVYNLAVRDGFQNLGRNRVETLNSEVRTELTPTVTDLYSGAGALSELPQDGGTMSTSDLEKILLYRLGLEAVAANEGTDVDSVTLDPETREKSQLSALLDDLSSGVVSGFGRNGFELNSLPYKPLSFIDRYETSLEVYAEEYGNQELQNLIDQQTTSEEAGPESGNSAFSRFVSRDARCENTEQVSQFFGRLSGLAKEQRTLAAEAADDEGAVNGKYIAASGVEFTFDGIGVSASIPTEQSGTTGTEDIDVVEGDLWTCSLNENQNGELTGLVRFVANIDGDDDRDEVTIVYDGDDELGILIANDSGTDYAAFGDVNAQGGANPDDGQDGDEVLQACVEGYTAISANRQVEVEPVTSLFGSDGEGLLFEEIETASAVETPEAAVDEDASTSALLRVYFGLLGAGTSEVKAMLDEPIQLETGETVSAVISFPDAAVNLNVLEGYTLSASSGGEEVASAVGIELAPIDVGGVFNEENVQIVTIEQGDIAGESFDEVSFRVDGGVLGTDIRTQVRELCYGAGPESTQ